MAAPETVVLNAQRQIYEAKKNLDEADNKAKDAHDAYHSALGNAAFARRQLLEWCWFLWEECEGSGVDYFAEVGMPNPDECEHKDKDDENACVECGASAEFIKKQKKRR